MLLHDIPSTKNQQSDQKARTRSSPRRICAQRSTNTMGCFSSKPDNADPDSSATKMGYTPTNADGGAHPSGAYHAGGGHHSYGGDFGGGGGDAGGGGGGGC